MTTFQSNQPVSTLTVGELETLIAETVRRILHEESGHAQTSPTAGEPLPQSLLETFGSWQDTRSTDEIIADIYHNRTLSERDIDL